MRSLERNTRLETSVYEAIGSLEEEFKLDIEYYPDVLWLGRQGRFEDLGLPEVYRSSVESNRMAGGSIFLYRPKVIVLNRDQPHHINEESSHCFHLGNTRITLGDKTRQDWFAINVLIEMFGYLGSKILDPSRRNIYQGYPDYFEVALRRDADLGSALDQLRDLDDETLSEFMIHSQGYGLGERMFYAFESGDLSRERVKRFLKKDFKKKGEATRTLIKFRKDFWPVGRNG
jgi:hypothetical protein